MSKFRQKNSFVYKQRRERVPQNKRKTAFLVLFMIKDLVLDFRKMAQG